MADYSSLKVPELKKLLAERKLPQTGNKADLVARLQEEDGKDGSSAPAEEKPGKLHPICLTAPAGFAQCGAVVYQMRHVY